MYISTMVRKIVAALCVLSMAVFAQKVTAPIAEIDSAAYYEEMYAYNYQKFRTNESVSDVLFWTSVSLSALAPISAMFLGARSMGCHVNEDNDCSVTALDWAIAAPLLLFLPSWIAYGGFSLAKKSRERKFNLYYKKKGDYIRRRQSEGDGPENRSVSVRVLPLANPVDNRYGVLLALGFSL